eukprot:1138614-Pelagomonas_calceolata.AAC.1
MDLSSFSACRASLSLNFVVGSGSFLCEYAHKLVTTRRAIENKNTPHNQVLEPGAFSNPPAPH